MPKESKPTSFQSILYHRRAAAEGTPISWDEANNRAAAAQKKLRQKRELDKELLNQWIGGSGEKAPFN